MKPFADASFLVSFCAHDEHSDKAARWWRRNAASMFTSRLALFEAENALLVMRVGRKLTDQGLHLALETLKRAQLEGFVRLWEVPVRRLYPAARRLSFHHNKARGYGTMDLLHVACALDMDCDVFLSFDGSQRDLAKAEGMEVAP